MLKKMSGILLEPSNKYIIPEQILIETLLKSQQLRLEAMGLMTQIKEKHQGRGGSSGSSTGSSGSSGSGKSLDMQFMGFPGGNYSICRQYRVEESGK